MFRSAIERLINSLLGIGRASPTVRCRVRFPQGQAELAQPILGSLVDGYRYCTWSWPSGNSAPQRRTPAAAVQRPSWAQKSSRRRNAAREGFQKVSGVETGGQGGVPRLTGPDRLFREEQQVRREYRETCKRPQTHRL